MSRFDGMDPLRLFDILLTLSPFCRESLPDINRIINEILERIDKTVFHQRLGEFMLKTKTFSEIKVTLIIVAMHPMLLFSHRLNI